VDVLGFKEESDIPKRGYRFGRKVRITRLDELCEAQQTAREHSWNWELGGR
jgi:DNA-binding winged helix-turn-helix (wHTH) protein